MNPKPASPLVLVAQLGARRHYAVPVALHSRGMLEHFYTDNYASPWVKALGAVAGALHVSETMRRWASRHSPDLPRERVTAFNAFGLQYKWRARRARTPAELTAAWLWAGQRFCEKVAQWGFGAASAVYAYTSAALELFQSASQDGLACVLDHATAPKLFEDRLVDEEQKRHPNLFSAMPRDENAEAYADRQRNEWQAADRILCGSSFVQNAIRAEGGPAGKTCVVPLGMDVAPFARLDKPGHGGPLRVLFVGHDGLRKGLGDLGRALHLVKSIAVEARAIGGISLSENGKRELANVMTLAGPAARRDMPAQYHWADVFVMPSVSDTFGLVVLEAMAAGVPVITTPNTGAADIVRDGVDGFIVPIRAPEAIADKLDRLASDRALAQQMGARARERAEEFSLEKYSERLVVAILQGMEVDT